MNPAERLVSNFQGLVALVPEMLQPTIVFFAGAVPFVEGKGASFVGVVGGIHPLTAAIAAAVGNLLCVSVIVLVVPRARMRIPRDDVGADGAQPESRSRRRFRKWVIRFGVPGASILGPLALPTQVTSAMLVVGGMPRARVLLWQAVAIALWTLLATLAGWLALVAVAGV